MTGNTDEEHLDIPTNSQSENPSVEIIPAKDTEPINPTQEPGNMEVHQKPDNFDKVEAINIVGLYQLTFRGSLRKQYYDYEMLNAKLLELLNKRTNTQHA